MRVSSSGYKLSRLNVCNFHKVMHADCIQRYHHTVIKLNSTFCALGICLSSLHFDYRHTTRICISIGKSKSNPSTTITADRKRGQKKKKLSKAKIVENEGRNADACAGKSGGNNGKSRRIIAARSVQRGGGSAPFGPNRAGLFNPLPIDGAGSLLPRRGLLGGAAQSSPRHRLRCFPLGRRYLPRCLLLHFLSGLRFNLSLICCFVN